MSGDPRQYVWLPRNLADLSDGMEKRIAALPQGPSGHLLLSHSDRVYLTGVVDRMREIAEEVQCLLVQIVPPAQRISMRRDEDMPPASNVITVDFERRA